MTYESLITIKITSKYNTLDVERHRKLKVRKWNINNANKSKWKQYQDLIESQKQILLRKVNTNLTEVYHNNKTNIIDAAELTMCEIIHNAAQYAIGKQTISDIENPYITKQITNIINILRKDKKRIVNKIMNRIKNLKIATNSFITKQQIKLDIINKYGNNALYAYENWVIRNKNKMKLIRQAKIKYQNSKIRKLVLKHKDRMYYRIIDEISNIGLNKKNRVDHNIKLHVAVNKKDIKQKELKAEDTTCNDNETAMECNKYFNTIGNKCNPNYKTTLKTNRQLSGKFDEPYDLVIIFNHWKSTVKVTNCVNIRALIPYKKLNKSQDTIKEYRHLSVEKII